TAYKNLKLESVTEEDVESFFTIYPAFPNYNHVVNVKNNKEKYKALSDKFSKNDKEKHCFMGYMIAKKHDFTTSVFIAYYKEALDIGDSNAESHFEIADMIATRMGAYYFKNNFGVEKCLNVNDTLDERVSRYKERRAERVDKRLEELRIYEEMISRFEDRR
ncbi:MAG: hypothetical protein IT287_06800, partial [Bdellovibrionaceae bacterium]|nr:hypothetical protein [Pseudobdellovibrionaceae bacterium]